MHWPTRSGTEVAKVLEGIVVCLNEAGGSGVGECWFGCVGCCGVAGKAGQDSARESGRPAPIVPSRHTSVDRGTEEGEKRVSSPRQNAVSTKMG